MSQENKQPGDRRLSENGKNLYLTYSARENCGAMATNNNYLTARPPVRPKSCSPTFLTMGDSREEGANCKSTQNTFVFPLQNKTSIDATEKQNKTTMDAATPKTVQTGMDKYITILKRKRSPRSSKTVPPAKQLRDQLGETGNRFDILATDEIEPEVAKKTQKPPPIYLREQNSNELIKSLIAIIGEKSFHVVPLKMGNMLETKIQSYSEENFRKIIKSFETQKKNYYTFQLKSSKGLQVVVKGVDSCVDPSEVKEALENDGFKIKSVVNIKYRDKIPQPLFRVELEPGDIKLRKGQIHPIYKLKYLIHRRVAIEEPHRRVGPVQSLNCQEYGHTKAYCKLPTVCVVCGGLHASSECDKPRAESTVKKCSNCGENHTANYRGCRAYSLHKNMFLRRRQGTQKQAFSAPTPVSTTSPHNTVSYADILKPRQQPLTLTSQQNPQPYDNRSYANVTNPQTPVQDFSRLENTLDKLVQTINNFTNSMSNMMQEMMKMQSMLMQTLLNKQ